jgi:hypothetical protein
MGKGERETEGEALLEAAVARLAELQTLLYADARWSLLCVFQAMDAAGKDGTIKHVMSGVNPQGVLDISMQPQGTDRIEVVMPLPSDEVRALQLEAKKRVEDFLAQTLLSAADLVAALAVLNHRLRVAAHDSIRLLLHRAVNCHSPNRPGAVCYARISSKI